TWITPATTAPHTSTTGPMAISSWSHGMEASGCASTGKARSSNATSNTTALRIANQPPVVVSSPHRTPRAHVHVDKALVGVHLNASEPKLVCDLSHHQHANAPHPNVRGIAAHVPGHFRPASVASIPSRATVAGRDDDRGAEAVTQCLQLFNKNGLDNCQPAAVLTLCSRLVFACVRAPTPKLVSMEVLAQPHLLLTSKLV